MLRYPKLFHIERQKWQHQRHGDDRGERPEYADSEIPAPVSKALIGIVRVDWIDSGSNHEFGVTARDFQLKCSFDPTLMRPEQPVAFAYQYRRYQCARLNKRCGRTCRDALWTPAGCESLVLHQYSVANLQTSLRSGGRLSAAFMR